MFVDYVDLCFALVNGGGSFPSSVRGPTHVCPPVLRDSITDTWNAPVVPRVIRGNTTGILVADGDVCLP